MTDDIDMKALSGTRGREGGGRDRRGLRRRARLLGADGRDGRDRRAARRRCRAETRGAARPRDGDGRRGSGPTRDGGELDRQARRAAGGGCRSCSPASIRCDGPPTRFAAATGYGTPRERRPRRLTLDLDGWEGPLDLLLDARAQPEGRSARRSRSSRWSISISPSSSEARDAEARAGGRLSRDGGVARLPQIGAAAAARSGGRRRAPRNWRCGCSCGSSGSTRCARRARG